MMRCSFAAVWMVATLTLMLASAAAANDGSTHDRFLSRERQLTLAGRRAGEGYFSADGRQLILQSERYPNNPFFQIYTLDLHTGETTLLSPGMGRTTCSYFRPGSDEVLFASTHLDPAARQVQQDEYEARQNPSGPNVPWVYDEHFDIFTCRRDGGGMRQLTDAYGYDAEGAYSPDGKTIVFMSMRDVYPLEKLSPEDRKLWDSQPSYFGELYLMDADGSNQRRLTNWPGYDGGPFFTPDGQRVIFRHFDESGMIADIYTIKLDGTGLRRLTEFKSMSWAPFMHPSNEYAIFASNKLGFTNFELFIVDAMGEKEPVRVTYTDGFDGLPVFAPDGTSLCWTSGRAAVEARTAQLFMGDWDHQAAMKALAAAPPRGTPAPEYDATQAVAKTGWPQYGLPKAQPGLETAITPDDLHEHVSFLASDKLEGRMTGTPGCQAAGDYIAKQFKSVGLRPLGDENTFFQKFDFPAGIELQPEKNSLMIQAGDDTANAQINEDFRPVSFTSNGTAMGEILFAGYGLVVPKEDDKPAYDSYDGLDVAGKVVLVLDGVPENLSQAERIRFSHYAMLRYKAKLAQQRGAAGLLVVIGPNTAGAGELLDLSRTGSDAGIVAASITIDVANRLLAGTHLSLAQIQSMLDPGQLSEQFQKLATPGSAVRLTTYLARKQGTSRNVVGLLPATGSGPLAQEFVVVGAHYDHIGHGEAGGSRAISGEEGQIHNGADDNASGTATVLEVAAALAAQRKASPDVPRRGIIFACWSGEEIGVVGSTYFVRHAPYPLGRFAAYVNFDMVGRMENGHLIVQAVGSSPDWPAVIEKINVQVPLAVTLQDDPYLPTDTHEFYPNSIPVLAFFTGVHDDYNRPTDDADTLNYAGMLVIADWGAHLIAELSTRYQRLTHAEVQRSTPRPGSGGGRGRVYTGMIPDFASSDVVGLKISGAGGGSPAEQAGLQKGDVIVRFADQEIRNLEDYAAVLRAVKPDTPIEIVVQRDGEEVTLTITPTVRK